MSSPQGIVIKCEKLRQQESPQLQTQPKSIPQPAAHSAAVTHTVTPHPLQIDAAIVTHQSNSDHTLYFSGGDSDVTAEHHMVSSGSGTASSPATSSSHGSRKSHGHITTHAGAIRVASATEDSPADMEVMDPHLASCSLRKNVAGDAGMILGNCRFGNGPAAGSPTVLQGGYTAASSSQRKEATAARLELEQLKLGLGLQLGLTVDCSDHEEMHTANNISGSDRREPSSSTSSDEGTIRTLQLFPAAAVDHDGKHHWKDPFGRFIECSGAASDPNHIARHSRLDPPPPPSDFTLNPPNTDSGAENLSVGSDGWIVGGLQQQQQQVRIEFLIVADAAAAPEIESPSSA